jgi:electron transfer flavoprotein alpha subunit
VPDVRVAVLVKQIPAPSAFKMEDARVVREGVALEVNAYCRRANAKAVELAGADGEVVVFTMGPPSARDALCEMIACGASRGVHLCDPGFAGSDTFATAQALAAAIGREGPFDLVLGGLNSLDADTGQVPAELAELLGLPFAAGIRDIDVSGQTFRARLETDDGFCSVDGVFPVVLSTAERLCDPSKASSEQCRLVAEDRISTVGLADLDLGPNDVGALGSPTSVGPVRVVEEARRPAMAGSVAEAVDMLVTLGAFVSETAEEAVVAESSFGEGGDREIWCFFTGRGVGAELLGEAAQIAQEISAIVVAVTAAPVPAGLGALGADRVLAIPGAREPAEFAAGLAQAVDVARPWALLVEGTRHGRVVASIVAARHGWGLTGDAIGLEVDADERLVAWKPAFGGRLEAPVSSRSPVQMATIRPGILAHRRPRDAADPVPVMLDVPQPAVIRTMSASPAGEQAGELQRAEVVVAVGQGIDPATYDMVDDLRAALGGAALGATRKVTDAGWLPRSTQIGVTGHSVAPRLLIALASSGRFNHTIGIRNSRVIMAINADPDAEIFDQVDVGLVGASEQLVPELIEELNARQATTPRSPTVA